MRLTLVGKRNETNIELSIDIEEILACSRTRPVFSSRTFRRSVDHELSLKEIPSKILVSQDEFPILNLKEFFVSIPIDFLKSIFIQLPKEFREVQSKCGGYLFKAQKESTSPQVLWIPRAPVWRLRDTKERILEEKQCNNQFVTFEKSGNWLEKDAYYGKGRLEFTFITNIINRSTTNFIDELQRTYPEEQNLFEIGVSGNISKISDFWKYIIGKNIYHPLKFVKGRHPAQETALLIYETADYLWKGTRKNIYNLIKLKTAYSVLLLLDSKSKWVHGSWSDDMETHTRFQADGITLLLKHYQETKEEIFLQRAYEASKWLVKVNERIEDGIWFLHDTLEAEGIDSYSKPIYGSNAFGKSHYNSMTLNTHINTIVSLLTLLEYKEDDEIRRLTREGLSGLRSALGKRSRRKDIYLFTWFWNLRWHCPPFLPKEFWGKIFDLFFKRILIPLVKKRDSTFILPNGFSLRDLINPEGYTYHVTNLYDLARLYSLKSEKRFLLTLQEMMSFSVQEQYIHYYCFQNEMNKIYLPEAFYLYWAINGKFDKNLIRKTSENFTKSHSGISPRSLDLFKILQSGDIESNRII